MINREEANKIADTLIAEQKKKGYTDEDIAQVLVGMRMISPILKMLTERLLDSEDRIQLLEHNLYGGAPATDVKPSTFN